MSADLVVQIWFGGWVVQAAIIAFIGGMKGDEDLVGFMLAAAVWPVFLAVGAIILPFVAIWRLGEFVSRLTAQGDRLQTPHSDGEG